VPSGWTGTMPGGESYLNAGAAPSFTYHRFRAQADIVLAMGSYAQLFGE
jgi:hypothetical protein